jgi:hypothetical protein
MEIQFREFDPFNVWIWVEFETIPSPMEQQYLEEVFNAFFYLGKLGGFNAENLQVQEIGIDISYMDYDNSLLENSMMSLMHNMADFQYQGTWGRCWFDLGTSDLFALDVLINALHQLNREYIEIKRLIIGGENEDWPIDERRSERFFEDN